MLRFRKVQVPAISRVTAPAAPAAQTGPCPNCGDAAPGRFCPGCGQEQRTGLVSLREMAVDFLDDQLSLNSKLPRTLFHLLLRPGFLTAEYLRGRIARYIRPLRLYLGASVAFFLVLSIAEGRWIHLGVTGDTGARPVATDSLSLEGALAGGSGAPAAPDAPPAPADPITTMTGGIDGSWVDSITIRTPNPTLDRILAEKKQHFRRMTPAEAFREILHEFQERIPTMMFLLLPVFALLLKLFYARSKRLYVEHFVFALHLHAFAFAAFTVMLLAHHPTVSGVLAGWVLLYTFLAMRRVYGQSFLRTGVKYAALGWSYLFVLMFALAITAVVTLLLV